MDKYTVFIGTMEVLSDGQTQDDRRPVEFEADRLGEYTAYGYDDKSGRLTQTRGTTETLYRAADGRLVVHSREWSHWRGEPTIESLRQVSAGDLEPTGDYEALGVACGMGRPWTLDEALADGEG
jgi:hypothetical protein